MQNEAQEHVPHDLLNTMQRHAEFINVLLSGDAIPGSWLLFELQNAVAETTTRAFREVKKEEALELERGNPLTRDDETTRFLVVMAQMNGLAQVIGLDHSGSTFCDSERFCIPDPLWWYDGLRALRFGLKPYLRIADEAWGAELAREEAAAA